MTCPTCNDTRKVWNNLLQEYRGCPDCNEEGLLLNFTPKDTKDEEMKDETRNINPTAPALIAMTWWGTRYAAQRGGCMDFWDTLSESEQRTCRELAEQVKAAPMYEGEPPKQTAA